MIIVFYVIAFLLKRCYGVFCFLLCSGRKCHYVTMKNII